MPLAAGVDIASDRAAPLYAAFLAVWGAAGLKMWTRRQHMLAWQWDTAEAQGFQEKHAVRPEFTGEFTAGLAAGDVGGCEFTARVGGRGEGCPAGGGGGGCEDVAVTPTIMAPGAGADAAAGANHLPPIPTSTPTHPPAGDLQPSPVTGVMEPQFSARQRAPRYALSVLVMMAQARQPPPPSLLPVACCAAVQPFLLKHLQGSMNPVLCAGLLTLVTSPPPPPGPTHTRSPVLGRWLWPAAPWWLPSICPA